MLALAKGMSTKQLPLCYRLPTPQSSKDCLVYLEDIVSGLVDIAAPLDEGMVLSPQHFPPHAVGDMSETLHGPCNVPSDCRRCQLPMTCERLPRAMW